MLTSEETVALRLRLDAEQRCLIARRVECVAAARKRVFVPRVVRHPPVPQRADAGNHRLEIVQASCGEGLIVERPGGAGAAAAGEEVDDAERAGLGACHLPGGLEIF